MPYVPRTVAPQVASLQAALLGMVCRAPDAQALADVGSAELHMEADAAEVPQDAADEEAEVEAVEEEAVKAEEEVAGEEEQEQEQKLEQEQEQEITAVQAARRLRTLLASVQGQLRHSEP